MININVKLNSVQVNIQDARQLLICTVCHVGLDPASPIIISAEVFGVIAK
jgi:hypothetical protein